MKYILIALLLAGAAWATDYWIRIWGNETGLYVEYCWYENDTDAEWARKSFKIDSLTDIKPTPQEMEGE